MSLKHRHTYESLVSELKATETHYLPECTAGNTSVALVYPNLYSLGMSNLGFLTVHRLLLTTPGIAVERFFPALIPGAPLATPFYSFETGRPLGDFQIIMFSFSFEGDFDQIPGLFAALGMPVLAKDRTRQHPLLIAGGAAVASNTPALSLIFDLLVAGEAETTLPAIMQILREQGMNHSALAAITGVGVAAIEQMPSTLCTGYDINQQPAYTHIVSSQNAFGGAHMIELMRGCPRHCAFCLARSIYQPVRALTPERLAAWLDAHPGCRDLGLVAPSLFDHPQINAIFSLLDQRQIRIRNSSVKWEKLDPELLHILRRSGVSGLTLAPETGSSRQQAAIKKPLHEEKFINCVKQIFAAGFEQLKLYFIAGLPNEDESDLDASIALINRCLKVAPSPAGLSVAFSLFVPKHHTEWQARQPASLQQMKQSIKYLKKELKSLSSQLKVNFASPQEAQRQYHLSQAGPELAFEYAKEAQACRKDRLFSKHQFSVLEF